MQHKSGKLTRLGLSVAPEVSNTDYLVLSRWSFFCGLILAALAIWFAIAIPKTAQPEATLLVALFSCTLFGYAIWLWLKNKGLYAVPPRECWGDLTYWRLRPTGDLEMVGPGAYIPRSEIFSLSRGAQKNVVRLEIALIRRHTTIKVPCVFVIHIRFGEITDDAVRKLIAWLEDVYRHSQVSTIDRFSAYIRAETIRIDLPFRIELP